MMRTIGIWVFGLLASAIVGGFVASRFESQYDYSHDLGLMGALAGIFAFACIRLWLGGSSSKKPE